MSDGKRRKVGDRQLYKTSAKESQSMVDGVVDVDDDEWLRPVRPNHGEPSSSVPESGGPSSASQSEEISVCASASNQPPDADCSLLDDSFVVSAPLSRSAIYSDFSASPSSSDDEETEQEGSPKDLPTHLREWYLESGVSLEQVRLLLARLRLFYPELPADARTIAGTPRTSGVIKTLETGTYIHLGLAKNLAGKALHGVVTKASTLNVDIGVDGVRLSNGSDLQGWPILARSLDLVDNKPFCIGIFCGYGKPVPFDAYLQDYIDEVQTILKEGITVNEKHFSVLIQKYICDAPARAEMKSIVYHTGFSACERCDMEGEHVDNRHVYEPRIARLRTDESFRDMTDEMHHVGVSPLTVLPTGFVSMFVLDPMHLLHHGVFKRFLHFLTKECKSGARLRASEIEEISNKLVNLKDFIPCDFQRKPHSLESASRWKGTELRLCLLYTVIIAFKGIVRDEVYQLTLLLHVASRIVSSPKFVKIPGMIDFAEKSFAAFVETAHHSSVLGRRFVVYNIHSLLHLCDDVRRYGDVNGFSAYPFENHLGLIKRMLRSGVKATQQIARRLCEMDNAPFKLPEVPSEEFVFSRYCEATKCYQSMRNAKFMLSPKPHADSYFLFRNSLGKVKKIVKTHSGVKIIADVCEDLHNFYTYPDESKNVGVYLFNRWTGKDIELPVDLVEGKCMVLPATESSWVAILLLHTSM